jgi:hypothetical protein
VDLVFGGDSATCGVVSFNSSDRTVRLWQPSLRAESLLHLTTAQHTPSAVVATASGLSGVVAAAASAGIGCISGGAAAVEDASNPLFSGEITNVAFGYQGVCPVYWRSVV